jgi:hypothetical protein
LVEEDAQGLVEEQVNENYYIEEEDDVELPIGNETKKVEETAFG